MTREVKPLTADSSKDPKDYTNMEAFVAVHDMAANPPELQAANWLSHLFDEVDSKAEEHPSGNLAVWRFKNWWGNMVSVSLFIRNDGHMFVDLDQGKIWELQHLNVKEWDGELRDAVTKFHKDISSVPEDLSLLE